MTYTNQEIELIKSVVKENLTDEEAVDLLQKMDKVKTNEKQGKPYMTFDWCKAMLLIFTYNIKNAAFGLKGDWKDSSAIGLKDGQPCDPIDTSKFGYALSSNWGIPQLRDLDRNECYDCYKILDKEDVLNYSKFGYEPWWPEDIRLSFKFIEEIINDLT